MSAGAYRILGFAVWHGGRWYLRRRLPRSRGLAARTLAAGAGVAALAALAKRASG